MPPTFHLPPRVSLQSCFGFSEFRSLMTPRFYPQILIHFRLSSTLPIAVTGSTTAFRVCVQVVQLEWCRIFIRFSYSVPRVCAIRMVSRISAVVTEFEERLRKMQHVFIPRTPIPVPFCPPNVTFVPWAPLFISISAIAYVHLQ